MRKVFRKFDSKEIQAHLMHVTLEVVTILKNLLLWWLLIILLFYELSDQYAFIVPTKLSNQLWQFEKVILLSTRNSAKYALLFPHGNDFYKLKIAIFHFNDNWAIWGMHSWYKILNSQQETKDKGYKHFCDGIIPFKNQIIGVPIRIIIIYLKYFAPTHYLQSFTKKQEDQ